MTAILLVITSALATWLFCLWQTEKRRRKSIQRSHNSAVRRSMTYRHALQRLRHEATNAPDELMTPQEFIEFVGQYASAALGDGIQEAGSTDGL